MSERECTCTCCKDLRERMRCGYDGTPDESRLPVPETAKNEWYRSACLCHDAEWACDCSFCDAVIKGTARLCECARCTEAFGKMDDRRRKGGVVREKCLTKINGGQPLDYRCDRELPCVFHHPKAADAEALEIREALTLHRLVRSGWTFDLASTSGDVSGGYLVVTPERKFMRDNDGPNGIAIFSTLSEAIKAAEREKEEPDGL